MKQALRRRSLVSLALATGLAGKASAQTGRQARIGVMILDQSDLSTQLLRVFADGLAETGFIIGRDVLVEYRFHGGDPERMAAQAAELVAMKVDVIYVVSTEPALRAQKATSTIPIVFSGPADPVGVGLVSSLAHPGGNITGISSLMVGIGAKQLELVRRAMPDVTRVVVLFNPDNPSTGPVIAQMRQLAEQQKIEITAIAAGAPGDIDPAFDRMAAVAAQALIVAENPLFTVNRTRLIELATSHRIPSIWGFPPYVRIGGLMSYGPRLYDIMHGGGVYVGRILNGAHPGDLPVQQPTRFQLVVNLKTARALGLTLTDAFLATADEVIE